MDLRNRHSLLWLIAGIFFGLITVYYFIGIPSVPFHPDESTYIFMSNDFDALFSNPSSLFWQINPQSPLQQHYREIDAPLTRYFIGAGLLVSDQKPISSDWNWSQTWEENVAAGALPSQEVLLISRFSVAWLFPLSLVLVFLIGRKLFSDFLGIGAAALFASNALILLHTRRAMEESLLVFGICLAIWGLLNLQRGPWIAAAGTILAFNAKPSAFALVPIAVIIIIWLNDYTKPMRSRLIQAAVYLVLLFGFTFLLNPFLWKNPIQAGIDAVHERWILTQNQVSGMSSVAPLQILTSPSRASVAMLTQLFITPPEVEEIGNYTYNLSTSVMQYFSIPGSALFRGLYWGGVFLILFISGFGVVILRAVRYGFLHQKGTIIFLIAFLSQFISLILIVPLSIQRYWLPVIPYFCIFSITGCEMVIQLTKLLLSNKKKLSHVS